MKTYQIALVPGDGIGPEVVHEAVKVIKTCSDLYNFKVNFTEYPFTAERYLQSSKLITDDEFKDLKKKDAILLGAIGDPRVEPGLLEFGIVGRLRFDLDLYINLRPIKPLSDRLCPIKNKTSKDIDILVVRENTEDCYRGRTISTDNEKVIQEMIYTRLGTERLMRYAFEVAMTRPRKSLTLVDKANAIRAHELYRKIFEETGRSYPEVQKSYAYVDAFCMWMIKNPENFDTVVTTNMFGDIITDLGAALQGGLGIAAGGNINPGKLSMFEPVHGSAPKYKGKKKACPLACILAASMMLDYLGEKEAAAKIELTIKNLLDSSRIPSTSADSGLSTDQMGDMVVEELARS